MQLRVGGKTISKYNAVAVSLRYDSVASSFSFVDYFNPANSEHKELYRPLSYSLVEILYNNQVLITGTLLNNGFTSSSKKHLSTISGYSRTGVIEDCTIKTTDAVQMNGLSLLEIATRLLKPFNLNVVVSDSVKSVCDEKFETSEINQYETIKSYLSTLASQKNIVLSHTAKGELLLTRSDGNKTPIFNFTDSGTWENMTLNTNGQEMHSVINVKGQVNVTTPDVSADAQALNPYLDNTRFGVGHGGFFPKFRPVVYEATAATDVKTPPLTARKKLGNELLSIRLNISIVGWTLNGKLPMPGDIVTVTNPDLFLYQKTKWFIESIDFRGDEKSDTATLNCVLPECFNSDTVKNIFTGTNLTTPLSKAFIAGYDNPAPL